MTNFQAVAKNLAVSIELKKKKKIQGFKIISRATIIVIYLIAALEVNGSLAGEC